MHDARLAERNNNANNNTLNNLAQADEVSIRGPLTAGEEDEVPLLNNKMKYDNRSTNENREGGGNILGGSGVGAAAAPQDVPLSATVLSRTSQLSSLISNLGAGDVVECYVVTRMAQLTNVVSTVPLGSASTTTNNGNRNLDAEAGLVKGDSSKQQPQQQEAIAAAPTTTSNQPMGPILIRKSGLAFRYRPRVASAATHADKPTKKYFEITLEYGPQRTGSIKTFESMPMLHVDTEMNNNKYVSWENEGRVYHSTHISNDWTEAYYMAPITGVVLEKILQRAVDYPRKRPRYQPFEVVSVPSGELIVRSSGSDDFVWEMFKDLADLYVDIDPILIPPRGKVQFYVADAVPSKKIEDKEDSSISTAKRREPNPNVHRVKGPMEGGRAALFYERFYNCANAIKTGDYSMYLPPVTAEPTSSPTERVTAVPSLTSSSAPSIAPSKNEEEDVNEESANATDDVENDEPDSSTEIVVDVVDKYHHDEVQTDFNTTDSADNPKVKDTANITVADDGVEQTNGTGSLRIRFLSTDKPQVYGSSIEEGNVPFETEGQPTKSNLVKSTLDEEIAEEGPELSISIEKSNLNYTSPESNDEDVAEAAEKAAIAAVEAAENAANVASTNSSAADSAAAASEAAKAAKKAADATVAARNKVASEGLISGDGALATNILSACFSDPKYGIIQKAEGRQADNDSTAEGTVDVTREVGQTNELGEVAYAYLYLDGDSFFRINLTAPYMGTTTVLQTVPPPSLKPDGSGDAVDWAIFTFILVGTLFGLLVMLHQGGCVIVDKRLRFGWFFKPTEHDNVDAEYQPYDEQENEMLKRGGGFPHSFNLDAIPTSMGGKLPNYSDNPESDNASNGDEGVVLLEMAHQSPAGFRTPDRTDNLPSSLRIRRDAPDQVERPSLITTSKPALPQQSPRNDMENNAIELDDAIKQFKPPFD